MGVVPLQRLQGAPGVPDLPGEEALVKAAMFLDPDTANSAIAVVTPTRVLAVGVACIPQAYEGKHGMKHRVAAQSASLHALTTLALREFPEIELCVSEFPAHHGYGSNTRPNDLIALASVIGAFLGPAGVRGVAVSPQEWKGNLNKRISQTRAFEFFGWTHTPGSNDDGVQRFKIPETVRCLTDIPQCAMGDLADAVAGAKWAVLHGKKRP